MRKLFIQSGKLANKIASSFEVVAVLHDGNGDYLLFGESVVKYMLFVNESSKAKTKTGP